MAHQVKLLKKDLVARATMSFTFEKPAGYTFQPGQATDWSLIDPKETDAEGTSRSFSIACAPSAPTVRIATRMRDTAFKRQLGAMNIGDAIQMDDPWGEFTIPAEGALQLVFLCGGIGITPFLSIIGEAAFSKDTRPMTLLYSNAIETDIPFKEELASHQTKLPSLQIVHTVTEPSTDSWTGEHGFIDWSMIRRNVNEALNSRYFIAGPPQMVAAMNKMLGAAEVPKESIVLDDFLGY